MENAYKRKQEICEIGQRVYNKGFAAANDGNISYRLSENEVLCTPTMHSKGFLKPTKPRCFIEMHYLFCILEQKEQRIISMLETRIKLSYNGFSGTCEYLLK